MRSPGPRQTLPPFAGFFNDISCVRGAHDWCSAVGQNEKGTRPVIAATADGGYNCHLDHAPHGAGPLFGVTMIGSTGQAVGENRATGSGLALSS
jgi:hypothetical protein